MFIGLKIYGYVSATPGFMAAWALGGHLETGPVVAWASVGYQNPEPDQEDDRWLDPVILTNGHTMVWSANHSECVVYREGQHACLVDVDGQKQIAIDGCVL